MGRASSVRSSGPDPTDFVRGASDRACSSTPARRRSARRGADPSEAARTRQEAWVVLLAEIKARSAYRSGRERRRVSPRRAIAQCRTRAGRSARGPERYACHRATRLWRSRAAARRSGLLRSSSSRATTTRCSRVSRAPGPGQRPERDAQERSGTRQPRRVVV